MIHVISPHLDDAVLSLGQTIAHLAESEYVEVHTMLAGLPRQNLLTDYDRSCGFNTSRDAMCARQAEDRSACRTLGARAVHWTTNYDQQYAIPVEALRLRDSFAAMFQSQQQVFAPLGIGHPDHALLARLAREACPLIIGNTMIGITVYEELPYRVHHPEQVTAAFNQIRREGWSVSDLPLPLGQGPRSMKEQAIAAYRSQFPDGADDPCLLVPERCWQIWKEQ